jgi:hypothetical protein
MHSLHKMHKMNTSLEGHASQSVSLSACLISRTTEQISVTFSIGVSLILVHIGPV